MFQILKNTLAITGYFILLLTGSEVDDEVEHEDGIGDTVEDDPVDAEIVVEEGDGDWKNDEVGDQQQQHHQVPVEPTAASITRQSINQSINQKLLTWSK